MSGIAEIARKYDTDKAVQTGYLVNYDTLFGHLREKDIRLLELGINKGGSMYMWRDYFPRGVIVGLDLRPVDLRDPTGRIRTYVGGQDDIGLLAAIARENTPDGFDIIIDDCAHIGVLARTSFWYLFENHLNSGGIYLLEDWGTGYWDSWADGAAYRGPSRTSTPLRFRAARAIGHLQRAFSPGRPFLSRLKARLLKSQFKSHDIGMVGFVKELVDEMGMEDITHQDHGIWSPRQSRFRELRILPGHVVVVKD
ncbi:MAG: class I SAM-dependent methyltransferase [Ignavibacteriales bacterium]|nr:class I SAM-dependent methyltransferase [Ignavibacteriales bacterium]